ncbi:unnamed protein product, partial [Trichogramma brassicae]
LQHFGLNFAAAAPMDFSECCKDSCENNTKQNDPVLSAQSPAGLQDSKNLPKSIFLHVLHITFINVFMCGSLSSQCPLFLCHSLCASASVTRRLQSPIISTIGCYIAMHTYMSRDKKSAEEREKTSFSSRAAAAAAVPIHKICTDRRWLRTRVHAYTHTLCTPPQTLKIRSSTFVFSRPPGILVTPRPVRRADVQIGVTYTRSRFITQILYRGKERLGDDFRGRCKSYFAIDSESDVQHHRSITLRYVERLSKCTRGPVRDKNQRNRVLRCSSREKREETSKNKKRKERSLTETGSKLITRLIGSCTDRADLAPIIRSYVLRLDKTTSRAEEEKKKRAFEESRFTRKFGLKSDLFRHQKKVHDGPKDYTCDQCEKKFANKRNLVLHMTTVHEGRKDYSCDKCEKKFGRKSGLLKHQRIVHEGRKDFASNNCEKKFGQKPHLLKHQKKVHESQKDYACDQCEKKFTKKKKLFTHQRTVHEGRKDYACHSCDKNFGRKWDLLKHQRTVHEGCKDYSCDNCEKKFRLKSDLFRHQKKVHEGPKDYTCDECEKKFGIKSNFLRHQRTVHEGRKDYACDQCEKKFGQKSDFFRHQKKVHEGPKDYTCNECEKKFGKKSNFFRHQRTVHEGRKDYACDQCEKKFANKRNLVLHVTTLHEGRKNYSCDKCEKKFTQKPSLLTHLKTIHEGRKDYVCNECEKKFGYKADLLKHQRSVHEGQKDCEHEKCKNESEVPTESSGHQNIVHEVYENYLSAQSNSGWDSIISLGISQTTSHSATIELTITNRRRKLRRVLVPRTVVYVARSMLSASRAKRERERKRRSKRKTARARNNARKILYEFAAPRGYIYYNRVLIIDGLDFSFCRAACELAARRIRSTTEEASPSCSRSSTSLDDESVVLHEKYMLVDGYYYPRWSFGDTTFDYEETTLAPADHRRVPSQAVTYQDHVLELLWNSRRNRGPLEKIQKGPTIEIESAEYRTFGTWGHSLGQLSSLVRSVAVAKRNRRLLRQWRLRRYDVRDNRTHRDASSIDCAGKLLLELGSRLRGHLAPIALALDRKDVDRDPHPSKI